VADGYLKPGEPEYPGIEGSIIRYEYDPRAAIQLIEQTGYRRSADEMFGSSGGQPLTIHFQTTIMDIQQKSLLSVADYLKQVGVGSEIEVLAPQRVDDREYRATRPGFELTRTPN